MLYRVMLGEVDASDDVVEMSWRLGVHRPEDRVGLARGRIVLDNDDGTYAPERAGAAAIATGTPAVIEVDDGGSWRRLFTGVVDVIEPQVGAYGRRMATVDVVGAETRLLRSPARVALALDVTAGEAVERVLSAADFDELPRDIGASAVRFASFGEQWDGRVAALRVIQAVVQAEGGRFAADREGVLTFRGRDEALRAGGPQSTLDAVGDGAHYVYGAQVVNRVRVGVRPRRVGMPGTVLWRLNGVQRLRPNRPLVLTVRLRDEQGRALGAAQVDTPLAGFDYMANTQPDGSGPDVTAQITVTIDAVEGGMVTLRVVNTGSSAVYLMSGARLVGTPIIGGEMAWVQQSDAGSAAAYGPHTLSLALPLLDSLEAGEARAAFELLNRANPRGQLTRLLLSERAGWGAALARTLFDRVRVIDPHTGHDGVYTIVGEGHQVTQGGARHQTTWVLERLPLASFWRVGLSGLGMETRLAG